MQVFKSFFKISKKRLPTLSIYFMIYMFIIMMFSFTSNKSIEANFQARSLRLYIQDNDQSLSSKALVDYLSTIHEVDATEKNSNELATLLYYRFVDYVLVIPEDFEEKLLANETENLYTNLTIPGSNVGTFVTEQISQFTQTLMLNIIGRDSLTEAIEATQKSIAELPEVKIASTNASMASNNSVVFTFFQYQPYILLLILFVGMSPILVTHNEKNMKARTLCSALSNTNRILQLALSCCCFAILTWLVFQIFGLLVFRKDFLTSNVCLAMLNSFVFLLFATVLALLISSFSPNENTLNIIANTIGLGMSFLCGVFVPQNLLGASVLKVARFLPAYWYIQNNTMIAGTGSAIFDSKIYLQNLGIQFLFVAACFVITLGISKSKKGSRI